MNVTSDQSVPFLASAAALTIPIGLPTTWLLIDAPNERPSCHPVYGAPSNAATGPPAKPSVTNWSFELKYVFAILPIPFVVSFMAPGNSNGMPWALRLVPPLYAEHHPTAGLHQPLDHGVGVLGRVVGLGRISPGRDALADLAQAGDELRDVAVLGVVWHASQVPDEPARISRIGDSTRQSRCSGPRTHRSPAATLLREVHPR